jgi:hypothetical protein
VLIQFLITSRTLHVRFTLLILHDTLAGNVTTAQNVILRSGLKSNRNYELIDFCFDDVLYTTLYAKANIVSGIAGFQKDFQDQVSQRITSILGCQ